MTKVRRQRQAAQDESEQKDTTMAVPVRERRQRRRLRRPTTCSSMLARFGGTVSKSERKTKGPRLGFLKHAKEEEKKGGTSEGSLASQRG
jgi:hypothetical protein